MEASRERARSGPDVDVGGGVDVECVDFNIDKDFGGVGDLGSDPGGF